MTTLYDVPAPAKINLFLHVTGRRPDGYHRLQTAFRFVDLCDSLSFDLRRDGVIQRDSDGMAGLAPADDLTVRAALLLQQATGTTLGAQIRYTKVIPAGGGLGGGSSNAATTLIALNRLWGTDLSRGALLHLAGQLGADVPVFIFGDAAFAQGTGDQLQALALAPASYVIVQPNAAISTAAVFAHPDLTRNSKPITITIFTKWAHSKASHTAGDTVTYFGRNDLEPIALSLEPVVGATATWLQQQGFNARLTGSGACFFVECTTADQAGVIQRKILGKISSSESPAQQMIKQAWACSSLDEHPLKYWIRS